MRDAVSTTRGACVSMCMSVCLCVSVRCGGRTGDELAGKYVARSARKGEAVRRAVADEECMCGKCGRGKLRRELLAEDP
jgi:hypothetical protein